MNERAFTRVISITSGKGGVGKTTTTVNLALALAEQGRSVLVLDADLGLANVDIMLGITPRYTLLDLFEGRRTLSEIIVSGPSGISVIPAASGVERMATLSTEERMLLMEAVEEVAARYDYLLIDTQAGIGKDVLHFSSAASEIICVVNGQPTSLTDAYALIKVLSTGYGEHEVSILVNEVASSQEAEQVYGRLHRSVARFLHTKLKYLGWIPAEGLVSESVVQQKAVMELYPSSQSAKAFRGLSATIDREFIDVRVKGGMQFFFKKILELQSAQ